MSSIVAFDPGLGNLIFDFNNYVNEAYSQLMSFSSMTQKRVRFKMFNSKIYSGLENNIAFYNGCLLWGYYIKKDSQAKEIEGNPFLNLTSEQLEEYDFLMQVNFIENYFDSYERDTQYYMGSKVEIPKKWKEILELYKEFLELNNGFTKTKMVADLILPERLQKKSFKEDIKMLIEKAVKDSNIKILLSVEI